MQKHFKSQFPAANVLCLNADVAMDTDFFHVLAHDDGVPGHGGATMVQMFSGVQTNLTAVFPMKNEQQIPGTVKDFIREHGAPKRVISDLARSNTGFALREILRHYCCGWLHSEPHHQHQNKVERHCQTIK